ncbi:hypothetical protein C8R45DRAFT_207893 [Mycena sanguinolenta]|nr:hypothetical protein C8R45DRAFT_207893 [Mycena sanguinolenta]
MSHFTSLSITPIPEKAFEAGREGDAQDFAHPLCMESQYCMDAVDFTHRWWQVTEVLHRTAFELALYTGFFALFVLAMWHLCLGKVSGGRSMVLLLSTIFVLGTAQMALSLILSNYVLQFLRLDVDSDIRLHAATLVDRIVFAQDMLLITNNALTDSILIRRCYIIWEKRKLVTIPPFIMVLATTILGYISAIQNDYLSRKTSGPQIVFILAAATNIFLTTLTAGRIWLVGLKVRRALQESGNDSKDYHGAAAICLESGAIYSIFVIVFIITGVIPTTQSSGISVLHNLLSGGLPHVVNIVPTLIIVRLSLIAATTSKSESSISTLLFSPVIIPSTSSSVDC